MMLSACERTGMILAAEYTPSPLQLMLTASRQSGIGKSGNPPGVSSSRFGRERELPGVSPALIFD
jgi:hypothetical protein